MRIETFTKGETRYVRIRSEDGIVVGEMTMGEWSHMISNPKRVSK